MARGSFVELRKYKLLQFSPGLKGWLVPTKEFGSTDIESILDDNVSKGEIFCEAGRFRATNLNKSASLQENN